MEISSNHIIRRRWNRLERAAGFTAGVAVTLAAGYMFAASITEAVSTEQESTFVPITPCRLFDTRPAPDNVGPRNTPLGPNDTHVQQVIGPNGQCNIPLGATAVAINATAVGATAPSFATFFPPDNDQPVASNLNFGPGQAATPNKVDVKLSADGKVAVYNAFGQVNMIADVTGYYTDGTLDELSKSFDDLFRAQSFSVGDSTNSLFLNPLDTTPETVGEVTLKPLVDGQVVANYSTSVEQDDAGEAVECALSRNDLIPPAVVQRFESPGAAGNRAVLAGTAIFDVNAGETVTINVNCRSTDAAAGTRNTSLTATFTGGDAPPLATIVGS